MEVAPVTGLLMSGRQGQNLMNSQMIENQKEGRL